jgi:phosphoribosylformylglycinamidine synthase
MGGSHYNLVNGFAGGDVPRVDLELAPRIFRALHEAMRRGLIRACHDLSEGGLAAALAEMAFAGGRGADITEHGTSAGPESDEVHLFAESPTRFVVEVAPANEAALLECLADVPHWPLGRTTAEPRLRIAGNSGEWVVWANLADLKEAWQKPLRW